MHLLELLVPHSRLFTYKVKADRGSAPNPYGGTCSLAICKPRIRSTAKPGDIVVGFGCKDSSKPDEEYRIVYAMQVHESIDWSAYIKRCEEKWRDKIPKNEGHPGDCIYMNGQRIVRCNSWSMHQDADYEKDVERGRKVLLSYRDKYWYFGRGSRINLVLPINFKGKNLREIAPRKQGHKSNSNTGHLKSFIEWFNDELRLRKIDTAGIYGYPRFPAPNYDPRQDEDSGASASCSTGNNMRTIGPTDGTTATWAPKRQHRC